MLLVAGGCLLAHSVPLFPVAWTLSVEGASNATGEAWAAAGAAAASDSALMVDAANFGGVHHYNIPGSLPGVPHAEDVPITGALHVFLKALRWPDGHLRMKVGGWVEASPAAGLVRWGAVQLVGSKHAHQQGMAASNTQLSRMQCSLRLAACSSLCACTPCTAVAAAELQLASAARLAASAGIAAQPAGNTPCTLLCPSLPALPAMHPNLTACIAPS